MSKRAVPIRFLFASAYLTFGTCVYVDHDDHNDPESVRLFNHFQQKYNRNYHESEVALRKATFHANMALAAKHSVGDHGHTASFGMTQYSDWTEEEIQANLLGVRQRLHDNTLDCDTAPWNVTETLPESVDWRYVNGSFVDNKNGIPICTPVKNQGECGSCWAFSGTEVVESAWIRANMSTDGTNGALSVMKSIQCAGTPKSNYHCSGGNSLDVLEYATSYAIPWEATDPYQCSEAGACDSVSCNGYNYPQNPSGVNGAYLTNACTMQFGHTCDSCPPNTVNERGLMYAIDKYGPIAVEVDARAWYQYQSGVIKNHCGTSPSLINHAVVVVGYGTSLLPEGSVDYWVVRNSWGPDWGEAGYVRLFRSNDTSTCMIMFQADIGTSNRGEQIAVPRMCDSPTCASTTTPQTTGKETTVGPEY